MQFFKNLGLLVERLWREQNYDEDRFPDVAVKALAQMKPNDYVGPWDVIRWVCQAQLPDQHDDGNSSDLSITVYDGPGFYINVEFWLDGTTSIHEHDFSGGLQVLLGSSILSLYSFVEKRKVDTEVSVGFTTLDGVELLRQGDIHTIPPGPHCLFHIERPSATLVVRSRRIESRLRRYTYLKPYIAMPFFTSPATRKKVQSASMLLRTRHRSADDLIGEMLLHSDFRTTFAILDLAFDHFANNLLSEAFGIPKGEGRFEALLELAGRRHGGIVDVVLPCLEEARRQRYIIQRLGQITNAEHRFFLALLLNVADREKLIGLVKQCFAEQNSVETIVDWIEELANTRVVGAAEPNVLAMDDFDDDYLFIFQCLLEGLTFEQSKTRFEQECSQEYVESLGDKPNHLYNAIRNSMLFKSIFLHPDSVRHTTRLKLLDDRAGGSGKGRRNEKKVGYHNRKKITA